MKSKRFVLNALLVVALLALLAFSCWYANQPLFGYVLYAVMSGDKAITLYAQLTFSFSM